jgi:hypothetical protein
MVLDFFTWITILGAHYQGCLTQIQSPKAPAESTTQVLSLKPDSASGSTKPKRKFKAMRESNTEV